MSDETPARILLVVEAARDAETVATRVDKVLIEHEKSPSWLQEETLPSQRVYVARDSTGHADESRVAFATWTEISKVGPRILGHGAQGPTTTTYATAARRAIKTAVLAKSCPNVLVLVVDLDDQRDRIAGLHESRTAEADTTLRVVVGAADPKREAWVLNALNPASPAAKKRKESLAAELTFDPCREAHRLRAKDPGSPRDIKRVLAALVEDPDTEVDHLRAHPLQVLAERGRETGLSDFLDEASTILELIA